MEILEAMAEVAETGIEAAKESIESVVSAVKDVKEVLPSNLKEFPSLQEFISGLEVNQAKRLEPVQRLRELSSWLGEINPNFDEFDINSPYCNNCGSCAWAVYRRLEGMGNPVASIDNIGYNKEMEALTGKKQIPMSPQAIEQYLLEQGSGAHAIIGIDRAEGPGHWFNAANIDGRVVAIDGQSAEIFDWPPYYGNVVNWEISI